MGKWTVAMIVVLTLTTATYSAKAETGIGIQFGEPVTTGLSLRFDNIALGIGWSTRGDGYFAVDADYWIEKNDLAKNLDWYWGIGAGIRLDDPFRLDARVPVGLQWMPDKKWEVFGHLVPSLELIENIGFRFSAAVGVRYIL